MMVLGIDYPPESEKNRFASILTNLAGSALRLKCYMYLVTIYFHSAIHKLCYILFFVYY